MAGDGAGGGYPLSLPATISPSQLRRAIRRARRALTPREQRDHGIAVANQLRRHPLFLRAARIGAYLATDGEIDSLPLLYAALAAGKRCYLPVLHPFAGPSLWFCEWRDGEPLVPNRFAIPEPMPSRRPPHHAWHLDLLLVPLVAFDSRGNRLGMGGGYYDRTLSYLRDRRHWRRPRIIGLAHALQRVDALPKNAWDIPVDGVITEREMHRFTQR
jgi:5-formyltetrahydrofolate cyclo-ligase